MRRPRLRVTTGPSALGVMLSYDEAQALARYLATVTGTRKRVSPHPMRSLGWVVDEAREQRPRLEVVR